MNTTKGRRTTLCLILLLVWLAFIFTHSLMPASESSAESIGVLSLLNSLLPFTMTHHTVRKIAHFVEFMALGILAELYYYRRMKIRWASLLAALLTGVVAAMTDEAIQLFVDGRSGEVRDVWLDAFGMTAGVALYYFFRLLRDGAARRKKSGGTAINDRQ